MTFGEILKDLMQKHGITQKQLGKEMNYCEKTMCNWCRGRNEPNIASLIYLADRFGVSIDYLVGHKPRKKPYKK